MYFNREDYGSRIRSLRKKRGLTQEQLAEKMRGLRMAIALLSELEASL